MVFKFTIDNILNKYIPRNRVDRLPKPIARVLGKHPVKPVADYWIWLEILVASFCGIATIEGIFKSQTVFSHHHAPIIIASYGALAILCFNAVGAPLSQPRNVICGQIISLIVGVGIQKLFGLLQAGRDNYWASGALSVGVSSVLMTIFNCVHPPAGALSLIPLVDAEIQLMGWWYIPMQIILSVVMLSIACITGNIIRSYPSFWWTPVDLSPPPKIDEVASFTSDDIESMQTNRVEKISTIPLAKEIIITAHGVLVPEEFDLDELDREWLNTFRRRLKETEGEEEIK